MSALRYEAAFTRDLERIVAHLAAHEVDDIQERVGGIFEAIELLQRHPLIGRPVPAPRRELVIGRGVRGVRGYVALYRYDEAEDEVIVLGLRAQREAGFGD
ncbi:MAG: type II toxin-antitoxin system RelE/ParE family toxin [Rubrivivax sp.]|nr:type II toxin-antitoxin system RelE/ParE family toxin [Rubrivivax sp.]